MNAQFGLNGDNPGMPEDQKIENSGMVERVVRAMQQRAKEPVGNINSLEPVLVGSLGDTWAYLARAAIEAMREPTEEMLEAFYGKEPNGVSPQRWLGNDWRDMIDAALK